MNHQLYPTGSQGSGIGVMRAAFRRHAGAIECGREDLGRRPRLAWRPLA